MTQLLSLLITGAVTGGIYSILASGLVITYLTTGIFDFSYGAVAFSVAYFYYQAHVGLGVPVVPAALLAILVFGPLLGLLLDRLIYRHLVQAPLMARIIAPIGVLVALPNLMYLISDWLTTTAKVPLADPNDISSPPGIGPFPAKIWSFAHGAELSSDQLAIFIAAVVVALLLWLLTRHSPLGLKMRAVVDRRSLASLRGIDPARVSTQAVLISALLASISGVLLAPIFDLLPDTFTYVMFVSAAAAALGRFRSIPLAFVGGIALGIAQDLVAGYINVSSGLVPGLKAGVPFIVLFIMLYVLGRRGVRIAGTITEDEPPPDYLSDLPRWRRALPWAVLTAGLLIWIPLASSYYDTLISQGVALAIVFLAFVVITGIGGLVSFAQAAFVSLGAIVAALAISHGTPFLVAVLIGAVSACILGLIVALPSLRLGGLSLALATLAAGFLADYLLFNIGSLTGGSSGRPLVPPTIGPFNLSDPLTYAYFLLIIFGIVALGVRNLEKSRTGRLMIAIRSSEAAAASSGASTIAPRLVLFAISALIAGFGGALLAANNLQITGTDFPTDVGLFWIAVIVVFGVRRIGGAFLAGLLSYLVPQLLTYVTTTTLLPNILFGMGAMTLAQQPDGFMAVVGLARQARRRRRAEAAAASAETQAEAPAGPSAEPVHPAGLALTVGAAAPQTGLDQAPSDCAIELRGVSAGYDDMIVLHDINLSVAAGDLVAIVGPNGAGKSTLCGVLAGTLQPVSGSVCFGGRDISSSPAHERARSGLFLAPEYRGVFAGLSVEENLQVWLRDPRLRKAAMERFPVLGQRRKVLAGSLSGGEQQLLTMVSALERPPSVLVVDEPSLGLSPIAAKQVFDTLAAVHAAGTTVIVVEEQARRALELAHTLVLLNLGRVSWQGPSSELTADHVQELYLGTSGER
jgi:ABC-type branched-subunit amino acid transport system ATPase component/branched-subunit amino acid ABC-type transport system permease component